MPQVLRNRSGWTVMSKGEYFSFRRPAPKRRRLRGWLG